MSAADRRAAAERRAAEEEKSREVAYVRAEKGADDAALERLAQHYAAQRGDAGRNARGARKRMWKCDSCSFKNIDAVEFARDVCGNCLAPRGGRGGGAGAVTGNRNDLRPPRATLDQSARVLQIGGRSYRTFVAPPSSRNKNRRNENQAAPQQVCDINDDDEPGDCQQQVGAAGGVEDFSIGYDELMQNQNQNHEEDDVDGIQFDSQRQCFVLEITVPNRYWKFVIGKGGKNLQEIQRMTGATILMNDTNSQDGNQTTTTAAGGGGAASQQNSTQRAQQYNNNNTNEDDKVTLLGPNKASICAARVRIDGIVLENDQRVDYTHFLSIPLAIVPSSRAQFSVLLQDMQRMCVADERRIDSFSVYLFF